MHPTRTFVPPTVIKALAEMPGCNMTPAMASAAANLWHWGLHRQKTGKRCELKAYERDSGINRDTLAGWMKRLEQVGLAERAGQNWRCTFMEGGPKLRQEGAENSGSQVPEPSAQGAGDSGPTKKKNLKEKKEEAPKSRKEELIFQIIRVWNQQKPSTWEQINKLPPSRLKNLESLGYKGVTGLEEFLDDLPFILRGVKADSWWSGKEMSFSNLTRPTKTHCVDFLEKGKRLAGPCATSDSLDTLEPDHARIWKKHLLPNLIACNIPLQLSPHGYELSRREGWSDEQREEKHAEAWLHFFGTPFQPND